jgi:predicted DNA binding protein
MSLIAHVSVPAEDVLVGDLFTSSEEFTIDLVEMVPTGEGHVPYVRVTADEGTLRSFERTVRADGRVAFLRTVDETDGSVLYRIEWAGLPDGFLESCITDEMIVEDATGTADTWRFRILVPDHAALTSFHRRCLDAGIPVTLRRVYHREDADDRFDWGTTPAQREAIMLAHSRGYFSVPRETTLSELAAELGISHQAASGRLRRGLESLVGNTLMLDVDLSSDEP